MNLTPMVIWKDPEPILLTWPCLCLVVGKCGLQWWSDCPWASCPTGQLGLVTVTTRSKDAILHNHQPTLILWVGKLRPGKEVRHTLPLLCRGLHRNQEEEKEPISH